jgi:uncharacterized protein YcfJ
MQSKTIPLLIAVLAGNAAVAGDFIDTAPVVSATPIIERISQPRQECYSETAAAPQRAPERSIAAPILGGLAGALLGRQIGHGNGRDVATAVGAAAGAMTGDAVANPDAQRSYTGAAVGAVAGGLLGSQVGNGSGKGASTAAGTIAGAMIGDRVAGRPATAARPVQRCRTVETSQEIVKGYNVVYRYHGRDIATVLPYDPGNTVKLSVGVVSDGVADNGRDFNRRPLPPVSRYEHGDTGTNPNYSYRY